MNAATDAVERLPDPEMVLSVDDPGGTDIIRAVPCVRLAGSVGRKEEDLVPVEEALVIRINGQKAVEVTITPREIGDFVLGHLVCQGFIRVISDVRELNLGRGWAEVILEGDNSATGTATKPKKRILAEEDMVGEGIDRLSADLRADGRIPRLRPLRAIRFRNPACEPVRGHRPSRRLGQGCRLRLAPRVRPVTVLSGNHGQNQLGNGHQVPQGWGGADRLTRSNHDLGRRSRGGCGDSPSRLRQGGEDEPVCQ
jgi:hypothetical protein